MRLTQEIIHTITGKRTRSAQARWFKTYLGVDVPCDLTGPVMTEATYEALLKKRCGVLPSSEAPATTMRPQLHLVMKAA